MDTGDWSGPALVKVVDAHRFVRGHHAPQHLLLDTRGAGPLIERLIGLPWAGYLTDTADTTWPGRSLVVSPCADLLPGDVLELQPGRRRSPVVYRPNDVGNVLFATERCNNFCLMCSQPPRDVDDAWRVNHIHRLIDLVDTSERSLGISGGEPTLLGDALVGIVRHCAEALPTTHLQALTNGRRFSQAGLAKPFEGIHPSLVWAVPLYGDTYRLHDFVVQAAGAFAETVRGLYALHEAGQRIEIRVVLVRPSVERLSAIARFIHRNLPFVEHVALMGTEPVGFARAHHDALWVDPVDTVPMLQEAVELFDAFGMAVSLYNVPLCVLPASLWSYARRSISNWKQDYLPACKGCTRQEQCGGFFKWITPQWTSRSIAPIA